MSSYPYLFVSLLTITMITPILCISAQTQKPIPFSDYEKMCWIVSAITVAWLGTLIYALIPKRGILITLYILTGISTLADIVCYLAMFTVYNPMAVEFVVGSNLGEASEFIGDTSSTQGMWIMLGTIAAAIITYFTIKKLIPQRFWNNIWYKIIANTFIGAAILITVIATFIYKDKQWERTGVVYKFISIFTLSPVPAIEPANPSLAETSSERPLNVVIIIGESMSRSHCHFAGYDKQTTPRLEKLNQDSLLWIFNNVESPDLHTVEVFRQIMSTNTSSDKDSPWNTSPTIIEVARKSGYQTLWLSAQCKTGIYDNVVTKFGKFCDIKKWLRNEDFGAANDAKLDGPLIDLTKKYTTDNYQGKRLYILNLMGSHPNFRFRYPENFNIFKASQYSDRPKHQRETLAQYDNSILYTDYVLSEIINLFADTPTILIYLSDHGMDVYESSPNFCEHARQGVPESEKAGRSIPFVIYTSPEYKKQFRQTLKRIEQAQPRHFNSTDLIYTVMDLINVRFADNDDVATHSLIREQE